MPNTRVSAAGEAMPAAKPIHVGRFSGRAIILGDAAVEMAAAAAQVERNAASIGAAMTAIHGREYLVHIDHLAEFVLVVRRP